MREIVPARVEPQAITEKTLGFDGVIAETRAQTPPQPADVTFDDGFIVLVVEDAVDTIENLRLRQPRPFALMQAFQNAPLTPGKAERCAVHERIAAIREDREIVRIDVSPRRFEAMPDRVDARHDLLDVHGLDDNIVEA
ncbi:MAG: hypothetical protein NW216_11415 [Hyphomicrobium sp.]|nr:hypothetical protein [Hyphomicrobium sp.]